MKRKHRIILLIGLVLSTSLACTFLYAKHRIRQAEDFMPGYWVRYCTQDLEPTGREHSPEYYQHKWWLDLRDRFSTDGE